MKGSSNKLSVMKSDPVADAKMKEADEKLRQEDEKLRQQLDGIYNKKK